MLRVRLLSDDGREDVRQSHAPTMSVGRSADNDVRIDQPTVSSQHLRILSGLVVADCGSLNGTFIDGERLKGARLVDSGTEIELGGTSTRLVVERTDAAATDGIDVTQPGDQTIPAESVRRRGTAMRADETADLAASAAVSPDVSRIERERDQARDEVLAMRTELERAQGEIEVFKQELERLRSTAAASTSAESELTSTREDLSDALGKLAGARTELEGLQAELSGARDATLAAEREAQATRDAEARAASERDALRAELEVAGAELETLREQHAGLAHDREQLVADRERLERELREERESKRVPEPAAGFGGAAVEAAEPAGGGALFAHLNQQIQRQQQKIAELEAFRASAGGAAPLRDGGRTAELERELAELRAQLEEARAARPDTDEPEHQAGFETVAFENFRTENARLREENAKLGEELELARDRLAAAERADGTQRGPVASAPQAAASESATVGLPAASKADPAELEAARTRIADLERRLRSAESARAASPGGAPRAAAGGDAAELWQAFATQDVENREPMLQAPPVEFMTLEMLRVVRKVERVATRVAQDAIGNIPRETLLPGQFDNLRSLVARVLEDSTDTEARRGLVDHTRELTRWLLVSVAAQRKAAERLVDELRERLSEHTLIASAPLSAKARFVGKETELWRRAMRVLTEWTPAYLEDRLDELARNEASKLLQDA